MVQAKKGDFFYKLKFQHKKDLLSFDNECLSQKMCFKVKGP